jgi:hypothetical protein
MPDQPLGSGLFRRPGLRQIYSARVLCPLLLPLTQSFHKQVAISIVPENIASLNAPADDVMQGARRIYSGFSWHRFLLPQTNQKRNAQFQPSPHFLHCYSVIKFWGNSYRPCELPMIRRQGHKAKKEIINH